MAAQSSNALVKAAWRQYTMRLVLKPEFETCQEDGLDVEAVACTPHGILAVLTHDGDTQQLRWFNLYTRCEINRMVLRRPAASMEYLMVVDSRSVMLLGSRSTFEYFSQRKETHTVAMLLSSEDGFRNYSTYNVILNEDRPHSNRVPQSCVVCADGFVYMLRSFMSNGLDSTMSFFHVPFSELHRVAKSSEDWKTIIPNSVGLLPQVGEDRFVVSPYDSTSFAILQGEPNRIDVYDITSQSIRRTITVDYSLFVSFPPPVGIIFSTDNCQRRAVLQSLTGEKLSLDLRTGAVDRIPCFVSPEGRTLDVDGCIKKMLTENEFDFLHGRDNRLRSEWLVSDAVYLTEAATSVDGAIIGDFEKDLTDDTLDSVDAIQLLHVPIDKIHSLQTLALNAVIARLSKDLRMRITQEVNPRSVPEMVNAVIRK